jgi:alpha/beta superfamily hydrolase
MATVTLDSDTILVRLSRKERVFGVRRSDLRLPLSAVRDVAVHDDGMAHARGIRAPGLAVPGVRKIGTWRRRGARTFVSVRRGLPALHVTFADSRLHAFVLSAPNADALAGAIRRRAGITGDQGIREVSIAADGATLRATLVVPPGPGPHPGVVLIAGSGPLDRDANHVRAPIGVSRDLAEAMADRGIASLRYDRRGVGGSDGSFWTAGFHDNTRDAASALRVLREQADVDPARCFLVGHSEGAWLAAAVAGDGRHDDLAGVVLLAGGAKTGEETLAWQTRQIVPTLPRPIRLLLRGLRIDLVASRRRTFSACAQRPMTSNASAAARSMPAGTGSSSRSTLSPRWRVSRPRCSPSPAAKTSKSIPTTSTPSLALSAVQCRPSASTTSRTSCAETRLSRRCRATASSSASRRIPKSSTVSARGSPTMPTCRDLSHDKPRDL